MVAEERSFLIDSWQTMSSGKNSIDVYGRSRGRGAHEDWKQGQRVLIRCQAGMNRSRLIMALVLIREGYTADEAINLIRTKRSKHALFNGRFEKWLKEASVEAWRN